MFSILNGILRLRQLACHPQLIFPDFDGVSGKTEQIIDTFDTLRSEGHKVLIFLPLSGIWRYLPRYSANGVGSMLC